MNRKSIGTVLLLFFGIIAIQVQAKNYFVKTNGITGLTGTSWSWATPDLQGTIEKASVGDTVFVAVGKYYGGFIIKEGVNVMGGYTANYSNPRERYTMTEADSSHYSILNGEHKQRVLTQLMPFSVPTTWDGFIIENGNPVADFKKGSIIYSETGDNTIVGVLFQYKDGIGKMLGIKEISKQWGGYENNIDQLQQDIDEINAKNNFSGFDNTQKIVGQLAENSVDFATANYSGNGNYAAFWCDTLTEGGYTEWYLPAPGELQQVYDANIQGILKSIGKNLGFPYWTSSQIGNTLAWSYCLGSGNCHPALKYVNYTVSAAHNFVAPEQPNGIYTAGGGVFLSANGILQHCNVSNNTSSSTGGGVYVGKDGQLIDCIVEENNAPESKNIYYEVSLKVAENPTIPFKIYPNPANAGQQIILNNSTFNASQYLIIDVHGKIISKGKIENGMFSAPNQKGLYFLTIKNKKHNLTRKFIIN